MLRRGLLTRIIGFMAAFVQDVQGAAEFLGAEGRVQREENLDDLVVSSSLVDGTHFVGSLV